MARTSRIYQMRSPRRGRRNSRFAAIAFGTGVSVILIFALLFAISFGTRSIALHASALHNADEALRSATVLRAQAGLATHLAVLEEDFGFDAGESIETSTAETRAALDDLDAALTGLVEDVEDLDQSILTSARQLRTTVLETLEALQANNVSAAREIANDELGTAFRAFSGILVVERDRQAVEVASANAMMGRVGDLARFLVAFLVPTAAIILFRELSRRQQRQKELEIRLKNEKELGKARDDFVANASHELRTPLTSILGMAWLLEEDETVTSNPMAKEMVGLIISEASDLSRMVDDLLTTARLDANALHFQFENLNPVDEIREVVGPLTRAGAHIAIQALPALVRSDRLRLRQLLRNLLSNAHKYGGPTIRVVAGLVPGWYEIRVEDDGDGIPSKSSSRLFQRYLHDDEMPIVLGSVGLGLSIVRALTEGMGGAVWYERRQGWTSFVVRVPLATDEETTRFREAAGWSLSRRRHAGSGALPASRTIDAEA